MLWSRLTDEEQLALVQLESEGFVNPRGGPIIAGLRRKGLVHVDPAPRLMNQTFGGFVREAERDDLVHEWEHADGVSSWDRARNAILLLLVVGALVLFLTQPEALTRWVGVVTAIGSAAAMVANLFGFFGSARPAPRAG